MLGCHAFLSCLARVFFVVPRQFRASLLRRLFYIPPSVKENPHEQHA